MAFELLSHLDNTSDLPNNRGPDWARQSLTHFDVARSKVLSGMPADDPTMPGRERL